TLAFRGLFNPYFLRASTAFAAALTIWLAVKVVFPPDDYFADALMRAAMHFFDLTIFQINVVVLLLAALIAHVFINLGLPRPIPNKANLCAAAAVAIALTVYWLWLDQSIHASNRYYLRTALVLFTPAIGALSGFFAMRADGLTLPTRSLGRLLTT